MSVRSHRGRGAGSVKRFLRDAAVALFVGVVLVVLAMMLRQPADDDRLGIGPTPAQEASEQ